MSMFKTCLKCGLCKSITEFYQNQMNKDGFVSTCKSCYKLYYEKNKEKKIKQSLQYYYNNKIDINKKSAVYRKERLIRDPIFRLRKRLRTRLNKALKSHSWYKNTHFTTYIGCTLEELEHHIEKQFKNDMSWENYGKWHVDHIIPLASAKTEEELYKLCHFSNLQPLWATDNLHKSNKV